MKFQCDNCGHKLSVSDKHAGKRAKCPTCGRALVIPNPVAEVTAPSPERKLSLDDPRWLDITEDGRPIPEDRHPAKRPHPAQDNKPNPAPTDLRLLEVPLANLPIAPTPNPSDSSTPSPDAGPSDTTAEPEPKDSAKDLRLLDVPEGVAKTGRGDDIDEDEEALKRLDHLRAGYTPDKDKPPPERTRPWMIDIFLYPVNKPGITILLICTVLPFFLRLSLSFFNAIRKGGQGFVVIWAMSAVLWAVFMVVHWVGLIFLTMYIAWYVWQCILESAEGGLRAAEIFGAPPGLGEILWRVVRTTLCALFCLAAAIYYLSRVRAFDGSFWVLFGLGGFVFPMALLSMVMHDTFGGLNPLLVMRSIHRTLLHYTALVPLCYALCLLLPLAYAVTLSERYWHWGYVLFFAAFYLMLVMGHLLGRFYFKNEERLYWDA